MKKDRRYILIISVLALVGCLTHFGLESSDSLWYYDCTYWLLGKFPKEELVYPAPQRPLMSFLAILPYVLGFSIRDSFAVVSTFFSVLSAIALFKLTSELLQDNQLAFYTSIFFSSNYVFLNLCASALLNSPAWFFLAAGFYLVVKYYQRRKFLTVVGLTVAAGMFAKETMLIVLLYIVLYELVRGRDVKRLAYVLSVSLLPIGLWSLCLQLPYFPAAWLVGNVTFNPYLIVKRMATTFIPVIAFLPFGFLEKQDSEALTYYYISFVATFIPIMIWLYGLYSGRVYFLLFPLFLPLCSRGMRSFFRQLVEKPPFNYLKAAHLEFLMIIASDLWLLLQCSVLQFPSFSYVIRKLGKFLGLSSKLVQTTKQRKDNP